MEQEPNTRKKTVLLKNTVMLYILTFSSYFLGFLVIPYETRVLHTEKFGLVGLAMAIMIYFQKTIDFGFLLSATEEVSLHQDDRRKLSRILTAVTLGKLLLTVLAGGVLFLLCQLVPRWQGNTGFFFLYFAATVLNCLMPDFLYRGLEQMEAITVRTVLIKLFFTVMIFLFLHGPEDYTLIPLLNTIGNAVALLGVFIHLRKKLGLGFTRCTWRETLGSLRRSSGFFLSRIATTSYTAVSTIILDLVSGGSATAFYSSADKVVNIAKGVFQPISDSLYPYMTKNRDFRLVKKVLLIAEPLILLGCALVFLWAEPLCALFFGEEYAPAGKVLRAMLPMIAVLLPNYILGFPTLSAMGMTRYANYAAIFGSLVHVFNLALIFILGKVNMVTLGLLASAAELSILLFQIVVIYRNRNKLAAKDS